MAKALTIKQERFCQKYLECGNASEAYRFAYNAEKMKPETVKECASRLLTDPNVAATVAAFRAKTAESCNLNRAQAVRMLSDAILADLTDYVTPGGTIRDTDIRKMPIEKRRLIEKIEATRDGCRISLMSKSGAIERLSKMLGWDAAVKSEVRIDNASTSPLNDLSIEQLEEIDRIAKGGGE